KGANNSLQYDSKVALKSVLIPLVPKGSVEEQIAKQVLRLKTAQAEQAEIETKKLHDELVPIEIVARAVEKEYTLVRTQYLSLANKMAPQLINITQPGIIFEKIHNEVNEILSELVRDAAYQLKKNEKQK